jgi:hypothetical protein
MVHCSHGGDGWGRGEGGGGLVSEKVCIAGSLERGMPHCYEKDRNVIGSTVKYDMRFSPFMIEPFSHFLAINAYNF